MNPDWVVDMTIDEIKIEHKHEIFRHNVNIMDVPGCATCVLQCTNVWYKWGFLADVS